MFHSTLSPSFSLPPKRTDGFREYANFLLASSHNWDYSEIIRLPQPHIFLFYGDFGGVCDSVTAGFVKNGFFTMEAFGLLNCRLPSLDSKTDCIFLFRINK